MNFLIAVVSVTVVIATMMIARLVISGRALESRRKSGHCNVNCDDHECFQSCGGSRNEPVAERDRTRNTRKRSNSHAT